jgi:hypothetical protein
LSKNDQDCLRRRRRDAERQLARFRRSPPMLIMVITAMAIASRPEL